MSNTYTHHPCIAKAHQLIDEIANMPEFTDRRGVLIIRLPIHCGGIRRPEVVFEADVVVRLGADIVRRESIKI